jgi:L-aminopeptidase/D-esterase-like protein
MRAGIQARQCAALTLTACFATVSTTLAAQQEQETGPTSITDVPGILVGHHTLAERPTGCTVVIAMEGATGGVDVRGGAPGTRETALLDPVNTVQKLHAVVLSGGSAFGLDAATGTVRWLEENGIGFEVGEIRVPIVAGAILFDLRVGDGRIRPDAECGYRAAESASTATPAEGNVGAGAGATVGKLAGMGRAMKGGIGTASIRREDGLVVGALIAVNAVGDVIDPSTGRVIAGVRTEDGRGLADARVLVRESGASPTSSNTVIGVVATNASLTKAQATKVAQMAHDGLARAISPAHTPWDGDTIFALSTGRGGVDADVLEIGALAAEAVTEAILRAVRAAEGLPDLPSASDLRRSH